MWPRRAGDHRRASARASAIGARRLTSSIRSICSWVSSVSIAAGRHARRSRPARPARRPRGSGGRRPRASTGRTPTARPRPRAPAARAHPARRPVSVRFAPAGGERAGDRVADAAGGAGHQHVPAYRRSRRRSVSHPPSTQPGNTARVAVKPCRKLRPPTGPISPAAKNPAAGAPPSSRRPLRRRGLPRPRTSRWPRPLQENTSAPAGGRLRMRLASQPQRSAQSPHRPTVRRGRAAAPPGPARPARRPTIAPESGSAPSTPRTRKSPCSYSGLPPSITIPISSPAATSARSRGDELGDDLLDRLERRAGRPARGSRCPRPP